MASAALPLTTVAVHDAPMHLAAGIPLTTGPFEAGEGPAAIRRGTVGDAPAIHALINGSLSEGHLLPRTADDVTRRATRFLVVTVQDTVVGCAALAPRSPAGAEGGLRARVARLGIDAEIRGKGLMWGVDLGRDAGPVVPAALARGVVVNRTAGSVIRLLPPYVITEAEIAEGLGLLEAAIADALGGAHG